MHRHPTHKHKAYRSHPSIWSIQKSCRIVHSAHAPPSSSSSAACERNQRHAHEWGRTCPSVSSVVPSRRYAASLGSEMASRLPSGSGTTLTLALSVANFWPVAICAIIVAAAITDAPADEPSCSAGVELGMWVWERAVVSKLCSAIGWACRVVRKDKTGIVCEVGKAGVAKQNIHQHISYASRLCFWKD
eukprot:350988-Chlamydomonas_euryale.AAC.3